MLAAPAFKLDMPEKELAGSALQDSLSTADAVSTHVESRCSTHGRRGDCSDVTACHSGEQAASSSTSCCSKLADPRNAEGLADLTSSFLQPLRVATALMEEADADIARYSSRVCAEAEDWVELTYETLASIAANSQQMKRSMLPALRSAEGRSKHTAASRLGAVKDALSIMSRDATEVVVSFIGMRNHVQYIIDCAEVELDARTAEHAGQEAYAALTSDLRVAMKRLEGAVAAMDPSSHFWQRFYSTGKELTAMMSTAQDLRASLCSTSRGARFPENFASFCAAMEDFCQRHAAVGQP